MWGPKAKAGLGPLSKMILHVSSSLVFTSYHTCRFSIGVHALYLLYSIYLMQFNNIILVVSSCWHSEKDFYLLQYVKFTLIPLPPFFPQSKLMGSFAIFASFILTLPLINLCLLLNHFHRCTQGILHCNGD